MVLDCVVDTNVFSYIFNQHTLGRLYNELLTGKRTALSFITVGELLMGAQLRGWGSVQRLRLDTAIDSYQVLESNRSIAESYANISAFLIANGTRPSLNDAWIAATALAYRVPLVSHNRRDFEQIPGLELVSFAP